VPKSAFEDAQVVERAQEYKVYHQMDALVPYDKLKIDIIEIIRG